MNTLTKVRNLFHRKSKSVTTNNPYPYLALIG